MVFAGVEASVAPPCPAVLTTRQRTSSAPPLTRFTSRRSHRKSGSAEYCPVAMTPPAGACTSWGLPCCAFVSPPNSATLNAAVAIAINGRFIAGPLPRKQFFGSSPRHLIGRSGRQKERGTGRAASFVSIFREKSIDGGAARCYFDRR